MFGRADWAEWENRMDERLEVEKCRESANDGGDEGGRERGWAREHNDLALRLWCVVIRAHWWVCVPVGGAGAYLWLVMLWSAASDSPASPWPPVIQNMPLPARLLHERQRPDCWGSGAGAMWRLKLIFTDQVPGEQMCNSTVCLLLNLSWKNISWIICMSPQHYDIFKNLAAFSPAFPREMARWGSTTHLLSEVHFKNRGKE